MRTPLLSKSTASPRGACTFALLILRAACSPLPGFPGPDRLADGRVFHEAPTPMHGVAVLGKEVRFLQTRPGDRVGIEADERAAGPYGLDHVMLALRTARHG